MAKIEEITALLIDEINSFDEALRTLQNEREKIEKMKFSIDTSSLDNKFDNVLVTIENNSIDQNNQFMSLKKKLGSAIIIPKWLIVLFSSFFIIFILSISYNYYQHTITKEKENKAYNIGRLEIKNKMQLFFDDNPKALKQYEKWNIKK